MLEKILTMYVMAMAGDVRSPMPHLIGPPGCGKSTVVEQLAELVGVNLHIINVSRLSPLEVEGVQMPSGEGLERKLELLLATIWNTLKDGDILLMDEFLRGFPEVYNGLLDIFTSRRVGSHKLPKVFIIGASNSNVAYDRALEDRLLHIPVEDPRKSKSAKKHLAELIVEALGLHPKMVSSTEMSSLLDTEVLPMYNILDQFKGNGGAPPTTQTGSSLRKLIGQAQLRHIQSSQLGELITMNNIRAFQEGKIQHVLYPTGKNVDPSYAGRAKKMLADQAHKLSDQQQLNIRLNLQLIELEAVRATTVAQEGTTDGQEDEDPFA